MSILDLSAEAYHADLIDTSPTLSRSIAHILCTESPAHAYTNHPKLNKYFARQEEERFDLGTAAHELFLGGPERVAIIDHNDWRTNDAKEQRHRARVEGKLPLLAKDASAVVEMVAAIREKLDQFSEEPPLFTEGVAERTLVYEDEGVLCRVRPDWLRADFATIDDLKTTSRSANPDEWSMFSFGGDLQAYMYSRAVEVLTGVTPVFRFAVVETTPPFELSVVSPGPDVLTLARKRFVYAAGVWRRCLESGEWPGYERRVAFQQLPGWLESRWLAKEEREFAAGYREAP